MQNETFNNLVTIKQRIDEQRAALKTELEKLETDLERKISGQSEKPNSLALDDVLNANKTETVEEISRKIANIKAALAMPYYADSEFRAASIAYMEEMTANYTAELAAKDTEIEAAENAIAAAEDHLTEVKNQREAITDFVSGELNRVGLAGIISTDYTPEYMLSKYQTICSKYN